MEYRVSDKCQSASGGSYIAKYWAEVTVIAGDGEVSIEVVSTIPQDADPDLLSDTIEHIRRGAEEVAQPRALRATIVLHELVIHDVDCKPFKYQKATVEAFRKCLDEAC